MLDVRGKIIITLLFIVCVVTTSPQQLLGFLIYAGLLSWSIALSRLSMLHIFSRAAIVLPFSLLVAISLPFYATGETVSVLGIKLSVGGLWILAGVLMKSFLSVAALITLVSTTPVHRLTQGLRGLGVHALFVDLLNLTYRYLFVLQKEASRLKLAAVARGYRPRWLPQAVIVGRLAGTLFLRSFYRAERIHAAMHLRGYRHTMPDDDIPKLTRLNLFVLSSLVCLLIVIRVFAGYLA